MRTSKAVLLSFAAVAAVVALIVGAYVIKWYTADIRGEIDARERTLADGSYRIAAYDHFFDLCAAVQAKEATIASLNQEAKAGVSQARREQIAASLTAVRNQRAADIAEYNADAAKDYTIGQFKASELPYRLDPTVKETTCVI